MIKNRLGIRLKKNLFPVENKYISIKYIKISIFKKERREDGEREEWKNYPYDNLRCISESLSSEMKNPVTRSIRLCTLGSRRKESTRRYEILGKQSRRVVESNRIRGKGYRERSSSKPIPSSLLPIPISITGFYFHFLAEK